MNAVGFEVKTEKFAGPLDLLLNLIEKRQLFISDIALADVADDFIEYVKNHEYLPIEEITHFLVVASTLLLIKSKSLLPILELTSEEEENIEDLERRLKEYKRIKELSQHVKERFGRKIIFARSGRVVEPVFSPSKEISLNSLLEAIRSTLLSFPQETKLAKATVKKIISLEDVIERLIDRIKTGIKTSFREFSGTGEKGREFIIVSFLAVLELVKRGSVQVQQEGHFKDIDIKSNREYTN